MFCGSRAMFPHKSRVNRVVSKPAKSLDFSPGIFNLIGTRLGWHAFCSMVQTKDELISKSECKKCKYRFDQPIRTGVKEMKKGMAIATVLMIFAFGAVAVHAQQTDTKDHGMFTFPINSL